MIVRMTRDFETMVKKKKEANLKQRQQGSSESLEQVGVFKHLRAKLGQKGDMRQV